MKKKYRKKSGFLNKINSIDNKEKKDKSLLFDFNNSLTLAVELHHKGNIVEAQKHYEDLRKLDENNPICNTNLAVIYKQANRVLEAIELYKETILKNKLFINTYVNFSSLLIEIQDYEQALEICKKGLEIEPKSENLLSNCLLIEYLIGNYLKAKEKAIEANILYPNNINIKSILLNSEYKSNNKEYIDKFIDSLFKSEINKKEIHFFITKCRLMNNLSLSIKISERYLDIYPKDNKLQADMIGFLRESNIINKALEFGKKYDNNEQTEANFYINYGALHFDLGNLIEASNLLIKAIKINPNSEIGHLNLGAIYKEQGYFEEAEKETKLALVINPNINNGQYNLAAILQDAGKNDDALKIALELREKNLDSAKVETLLANIYMSKGDMNNTRNAILNSLNKDINQYRCHFLMSLLKEDEKIKVLMEKTLGIDHNQLLSDINKVDILFAKSNILHSRKNFKEASEFLSLANNIKQNIHPSDKEILITKSDKLYQESKSIHDNELSITKSVNNIFIVGMPRCGSTLLESILTTNTQINGLGETLNIEKFYNELNHGINKRINFNEYIGIKNNNTIIDKQLYNFMFAGFIINNIQNSRIIHCLRNPLDNILSIHRAHFLSGNRFSSSIEDCLDIYLMHLKIINKYKKIYPKYIYTICYDNLVLHPEKEIKLLVNWLNLKWENCYLEHHKFSRDVQTASKIQVRSPINSKSLGNWKNYINIFRPFFEENGKLSEISDLTKEFEFELPSI
tara:strand:+ start:1493 stop:3727 length:2235 start_codon:yes stop_codon:yes gene_type:complete